MSNEVGLTGIERRASAILDRYQQAQVRGDFLETVFGIHTAIEDALDAHLGHLTKDELRALSFSQKFGGLYPTLAERMRIDDLNEQRNWYAHPKRLFEDHQYRDTAAGLVDVATAAWPTLFGTEPPNITHPTLSAGSTTGLLEQAARALGIQKQQLAAADARLEQKDAEIEHLRQKVVKVQQETGWNIRWGSLVGGLTLLLAVALTAGFAWQVASQRSVARPWLLLSVGASLVLAFFALRSLLRFLQPLGLRRILVAICLSLTVATLVLIPFTAPGAPTSVRAGAALTRLLDLVESTVGLVPGIVARGGANAAALVIPTPTPEVIQMIVTATPKASETDAPVTAAEAPIRGTVTTGTPVPPTASPSGASEGEASGDGFRIGARVLVATSGSQLMGRTSPGLDSLVEVRFDNGEELVIVAGPEEVGGLTWWQVEGEAGSGWSAGDFLRLADE